MTTPGAFYAAGLPTGKAAGTDSDVGRVVSEVGPTNNLPVPTAAPSAVIPGHLLLSISPFMWPRGSGSSPCTFDRAADPSRPAILVEVNTCAGHRPTGYGTRQPPARWALAPTSARKFSGLASTKTTRISLRRELSPGAPAATVSLRDPALGQDLLDRTSGGRLEVLESLHSSEHATPAGNGH